MSTILLTGDIIFFTACLVQNERSVLKDQYIINQYIKNVLENLDIKTFSIEYMPESQYHPLTIENEIFRIMNGFNAKESLVIIITFSDNVLNAARLVSIENKENLIVNHIVYNNDSVCPGSSVQQFEFSGSTGELVDPKGWDVMKQFSVMEDLLGKLAKHRRANKG